MEGAHLDSYPTDESESSRLHSLMLCLVARFDKENEKDRCNLNKIYLYFT